MGEPAEHEAGASDRHQKDEFVLVFSSLHVFGPGRAFQIWKFCQAFHIRGRAKHQHSNAEKASCEKRIGGKLSSKEAHRMVEMISVRGRVAFVLMSLRYGFYLIVS